MAILSIFQQIFQPCKTSIFLQMGNISFAAEISFPYKFIIITDLFYDWFEMLKTLITPSAQILDSLINKAFSQEK